jgi:membrane protease subunit HflK
MRLPSISRIFNLNDSNWGRGNNGSGNEPPRRPNNNNDGGKNNNNGGPPDLDELWRDFNRRLGGLFGRKPGGPRGGGNGGDNGGRFSPSPRGAGIGVGVIGGIVVLLWLGSGFFIVQEGQVAVVTQFGKYKETTRAGFQWRLPYPIQSHEIVNQSQLRTIEVGFRNNSRSKVLQESLMLTDDENIVDMQFVVQYRLKEGGARDYLFNSRNPDESVKQAAESAMREIVGKKKMDFVLYEGRTEVAGEVTKLMQTIMDIYGTGVLISTVAIQNAQPPEQVQAAFDDAVKAGQDRERQVNEGQAYANEVIPRAAGAASRLLQEAEGYRTRIVENAEGDASRFTQVLTEYQKAPGVTRDRLYLDTMQEVFTNASKVLVDTRSGNNLLYLPLDKIMQQVSKESSAAVSARAGGTSSSMNNGTALPLPAPMSSSVPEPTPREALRSRDRNVPR